MRIDLRSLLFKRIDIAGLVVFRIMFGLLMAQDMAKYIIHDWVKLQYLEPTFTFKFIGFEWIPILPAPLMYAVFGMAMGAAIGIAIGAYYRVSCVLFFLGHTYAFLAAAEYYLNHAYLISLLTLLLAFLPAHRSLSVDVYREPRLHSRQIHRWPIVLLLGTLGIVYTFGAIAKLNADWLVGYEPIRHWLQTRAADLPRWVADILAHEMTVAMVAVGGTIFDFVVTPLLLWRRTRIIGIAGSLFFHLSNAFLFNIGVFPWFMLAATTLFFTPSWPRQLPMIGQHISMYLDRAPQKPRKKVLALTEDKRRRITYALAGYAVLMILVPLRHHLYPTDVAWTEEGHYFSWRMKLRDKRGRASFAVTDPKTGNTWTINPAGDLTERQLSKMIGRPDLLLQYVHHMRDRYHRDLGVDVEIRGDVFVSLNYRKEQRFIDPKVDLAKEHHSLKPYSWILPFEDTPLPSPVTPARAAISSAMIRISAAVQQQLGGPKRAPTRPRLPVRAPDPAPIDVAPVD